MHSTSHDCDDATGHVLLLTCHVVGREYAGAIERKQVAQQEAERQKFVVQKADQERRATGESRPECML